jgi:hypothetical protein
VHSRAMDGWLYYELFSRVLDAEPADRDGLTPEGLAGMVAFERRIAAFYGANRVRITGIYIFHYYGRSDDHLAPVIEGRSALSAGQYVEFIRVRFRVAPADEAWARAAFRAGVVDGLERDGRLVAWRLVEGYTARADVGARFGDLARGVDPTDAVVTYLTGCTELRFYLLDHPEFTPNHDLVHLYFNSLGLFYPQEVEALEARARKVRGFMERHAARQ